MRLSNRRERALARPLLYPRSMKLETTALPFVLLSLFSFSGAAAPPKAVPPAQRLPAPEHVTAQARQQLKARMGQHSVTMESLVRAVVLLDRPTIRVLATRIADEEVVAKVAEGPEKGAPLLPAKFYTDQNALAVAGRQLAAAAVEGGDDNLLAERFAAVTRTCVSCHSSYLHDRPAFPPTEQKPAAR
jgi:cytochrome c556